MIPGLILGLSVGFYMWGALWFWDWLDAATYANWVKSLIAIGALGFIPAVITLGSGFLGLFVRDRWQTRKA